MREKDLIIETFELEKGLTQEKIDKAAGGGGVNAPAR